jgi:hypothetical protein
MKGHLIKRDTRAIRNSERKSHTRIEELMRENKEKKRSGSKEFPGR